MASTGSFARKGIRRIWPRRFFISWNARPCAIPASAKTGVGVPEILEAIVAKIPPPKGDPAVRPRALIFDSWYDSYRGAMIMVRVFDGLLKKGDKIRFVAAGTRPSPSQRRTRRWLITARNTAASCRRKIISKNF